MKFSIPSEKLAGFARWQESLGDLFPRIMASRDEAFCLLVDPDPRVRERAIRAFSYIWPCDEDAARELHHLALHDADAFVRFQAGTGLLLTHIGCKDPAVRQYSESLLQEISQAPSQVPHLVEEVNLYFSHGSVDATLPQSA